MECSLSPEVREVAMKNRHIRTGAEAKQVKGLYHDVKVEKKNTELPD
jgi:hypothetical protein